MRLELNAVGGAEEMSESVPVVNAFKDWVGILKTEKKTFCQIEIVIIRIYHLIVNDTSD